MKRRETEKRTGQKGGEEPTARKRNSGGMERRRVKEKNRRLGVRDRSVEK